MECTCHHLSSPCPASLGTPPSPGTVVSISSRVPVAGAWPTANPSSADSHVSFPCLWLMFSTRCRRANAPSRILHPWWPREGPPSACSSWRPAGMGGPKPWGCRGLDRLRVPHRPRPVHRFAPRHRPPDCTAHQLHPSPRKRACNLETLSRVCQRAVRFGWRPGPRVWLVIYVRVLFFVSSRSLFVFGRCLSLSVVLVCRSAVCFRPTVVFLIRARVSMCLRPKLSFLAFGFSVTSSLVFVPCDPSNASVAPTASTASATRLPALLRRLASCCPLVVPDFAFSNLRALVRVYCG